MITDFGSARRVRPMAIDRETQVVDNRETAADPSLKVTVCERDKTITITRSNFTLRWAAPEVLNEEDRAVSADIWSFGWVCYEASTALSSLLWLMLMGRVEGDDRQDTIRKYPE